jgi:hypothetical protein
MWYEARGESGRLRAGPAAVAMRGTLPLAAEARGIFMAHKLGIVAFIGGFLAFSVPLFAHHGGASFDTTKTVTVKGIVTDFIWTNPHVLLRLDVKEASGSVTNWVVEVWNPVTQSNRGWSRTMFKAGDEVSVDVTAAKNGRPIGMIRGRIVINGTEFKETSGN